MFIINIEHNIEVVQTQNVGQINSSQQRAVKIYQQKYEPHIK